MPEPYTLDWFVLVFVEGLVNRLAEILLVLFGLLYFRIVRRVVPAPATDVVVPATEPAPEPSPPSSLPEATSERETFGVGLPSIVTWIGIAVGALSVAQIVFQAFATDPTPILELVLNYYETFVAVTIGWVEPYVRAVLLWLRQVLPIELQLYPQWKNVFVLMALYTLASWRATDARSGLVLVGGIAIGFVTSVIAGTASASSPAAEIALLAIMPILALIAVDILSAATAGKDAISVVAKSTLAKLAFGLAVIVVGLQTPGVISLSAPGIALIAIYLLGITLYQLVAWAVDSNSRAGRTGINVLAIAAATALLILTNAGLQLLGL